MDLIEYLRVIHMVLLLALLLLQGLGGGDGRQNHP